MMRGGEPIRRSRRRGRCGRGTRRARTRAARLAARQASHGQRVDKVLATLAAEFSRSHLQGVIEQGHVALDGTTVASVSRRVARGQRLQVTLWPTPKRWRSPARCSSSNTIANAIACGVNASAWAVGHSVTAGAGRRARGAIPTRPWCRRARMALLDHACRWLRENSAASVASTLSTRWPCDASSAANRAARFDARGSAAAPPSSPSIGSGSPPRIIRIASLFASHGRAAPASNAR